MYIGDCAQIFCSKVMASEFRLTSISSNVETVPRQLTPPIDRDHTILRCAIACKVMIVKLESCRVSWVCVTDL